MSLCQYSEQNVDLMRNLDIVFMLQNPHTAQSLNLCQSGVIISA